MVLDPIVKIISLLTPDSHPKVYDLTVPSTFNFGLANGLQLRDTAKTGYLQRRLVKKHEDIYVDYNGCLVNAKKEVVSFNLLDNWNPACVETIPIEGRPSVSVRSCVDIKLLSKQMVEQETASSEEQLLTARTFGSLRDNLTC